MTTHKGKRAYKESWQGECRGNEVAWVKEESCCEKKNNHHGRERNRRGWEVCLGEGGVRVKWFLKERVVRIGKGGVISSKVL